MTHPYHYQPSCPRAGTQGFAFPLKSSHNTKLKTRTFLAGPKETLFDILGEEFNLQQKKVVCGWY